MKQNINVEAENLELILENSHGDKVIIPANKRNWVKQKLSEGCHNCIDSLVETLPIASQYAQDGSVYPPNAKVKVNHNNQIKEYDISSPEYKDLYNTGKLMNYDKNTDTYIATPLKEVTVTAEAPQWSKDKRNLEKQYSKDWYIDNNMPKFSRSMGVSANNMHPNNVKQYEEFINNKVAESILKRNPNFDKDYENDRLKTLSNYSQKELEIIKSSNLSHKIEPSIWSKFEQGLLSVGNAGSPVTFKNENLTQEEAKKEDNPLNILQPLSIPSKMVQSTYKKDYSFKDALSGKQNNAGIVEDIVTDPLNLVGLGIWGKLSKANKFKNLDEAYNAIKTLDKASLEKQLGNTISDKDWEYLYRVQEKGFDIERPTLKAIEERVAKGEGKWYDKNILNNPELRSNVESRDKYYGRWFEKDPKRLDYYLADKGEDVEILRTKVPKEILEQYRIDKFDPEIAKKWSLSHETEYIIPKDIIQKAEKFDKKDWSKLIDEHNKVIDATKAGSKVLNKTDDVVKPIISSVDDVGKQASKQWQLEELPGLHLKSTMEGQSISKIIEPKTGLVNVEQALGIIAKESGGADKVALIRQGLGENIPKKMDYNEFRKITQDQLIPLEKQFATHSSDYGIDRLGYGKYKTVINERGNPILQPLKGKNLEPLENQTLILGNKNKFGRGSSAHNNPEETLGHIHFLRDAETPDVLTVTQIQSDAFQGTHRIMPKTQQEALEKVSKLKEAGKEIKSMFGDGKESSNSVLANYEKHLQLDEASAKNFTQKQLLDKNHQERYLQELVNYAGERGDVTKLRLPTSETAAKVQGYKPVTTAEEIIEKHNKLKGTAEWDEIMSATPDVDKVRFEKVLKGEIKGDIYNAEHQTILKKYSEQPKTIKKLFGEEPKIVTDKKGNTWYEFDIPNKFKEGKGEIKAFQVIPPAIGSALYLQSQNKNKSEQ